MSKVDDFLANEAKGKHVHIIHHHVSGSKVVGAKSIAELVHKLKKPRKIVLLVKAGDAVDNFIEQLLQYIETGDIIIDGGNSHFPDTIRRCTSLESKGYLYVGCGVSGGEEGARYGPSLMPGGSPAAWYSFTRFR